MKLVHIVCRVEQDDRENTYEVPFEVFTEEKDATEYVGLQDRSDDYVVNAFVLSESVEPFRDEYKLKLRRSAYSKLTPAERAAIGLTED